MSAGGEADSLRSLLAVQADRVRHPALDLASFLGGSSEYPKDFDGDGEELDLPAEVLELARLRRASLLLAAVGVIDRCLDDLCDLLFDEDGRPDPDGAEESFVFDRFPPRHRDEYDEGFFRRVLVSAVKVAQDLSDPDGQPAGCLAEEIIREAVIDNAVALCEQAGLGQPWIHPSEMLLEDLDYQYLFDPEMDGIEDDPGLQAGMGVYLPNVVDWFTPFNPERLVHPYAQTTPSRRHELHDLRRRLAGLDLDPDMLAGPAVDSCAPLGGLEAGSEVVALARQAADRTEADLWVPDTADPEASFAGLRQAAAGPAGGSGWLCWEPYEGADTVRTEPVVALRPHRHFPVGRDTPWVDATIGQRHFIAIPLTHVVSYRPDSDVRARWNTAFQSMLGSHDQDR